MTDWRFFIMASESEHRASPWRVLVKVLFMFSVVFPSFGSMLLCPNAWQKIQSMKRGGAKPELTRVREWLEDRLETFILLCVVFPDRI